ncbi:hypothetical protein DY000_02003154 [Brassica cretica]|uniref:Uncharacterized protein n=1 Tax=Brassica cretica TaxID=69181 RepID=A0ABQ7CFV6_BRACR|nr:hypothetical protein DY000_02003154 [Brassica cretica]
MKTRGISHVWFVALYIQYGAIAILGTKKESQMTLIEGSNLEAKNISTDPTMPKNFHRMEK